MHHPALPDIFRKTIDRLPCFWVGALYFLAFLNSTTPLSFKVHLLYIPHHTQTDLSEPLVAGVGNRLHHIKTNPRVCVFAYDDAGHPWSSASWTSVRLCLDDNTCMSQDFHRNMNKSKGHPAYWTALKELVNQCPSLWVCRPVFGVRQWQQDMRGHRGKMCCGCTSGCCLLAAWTQDILLVSQKFSVRVIISNCVAHSIFSLVRPSPERLKSIKPYNSSFALQEAFCLPNLVLNWLW